MSDSSPAVPIAGERVEPVDETFPERTSVARPSPWARLADPASPALTYGGLAAIVAGFGIIAITWARVAALAAVVDQIPYVVSGGFSGLGLVLVGVAAVVLAYKRREAAERRRQLDEMRAMIAAVTDRLATGHDQ